MAKKKKEPVDAELSDELDRVIGLIQRDIENAIREGFSLAANPKIIGYTVSVEKNELLLDNKKKVPVKKEPDLFYEKIENKDAVLLLVQFYSKPTDFDISFDDTKNQLILNSQFEERFSKKRIPFSHPVDVDKKQIKYKNSILEITFPKK